MRGGGRCYKKYIFEFAAYLSVWEGFLCVCVRNERVCVVARARARARVYVCVCVFVGVRDGRVVFLYARSYISIILFYLIFGASLFAFSRFAYSVEIKYWFACMCARARVCV